MEQQLLLPITQMKREVSPEETIKIGSVVEGPREVWINRCGHGKTSVAAIGVLIHTIFRTMLAPQGPQQFGSHR